MLFRTLYLYEHFLSEQENNRPVNSISSKFIINAEKKVSMKTF